MVIDNMKFTQLPDGRIDVMFQCENCKKFMEIPERSFKKLSPFGYVFTCNECWDECQAKWERENQERLQSRTMWQKFKDFWF